MENPDALKMKLNVAEKKLVEVMRENHKLREIIAELKENKYKTAPVYEYGMHPLALRKKLG